MKPDWSETTMMVDNVQSRLMRELRELLAQWSRDRLDAIVAMHARRPPPSGSDPET